MKKAIWVWDSRYPFTQPLKFYNFLQDKEVDKVYLQINSTISMTQYQTLSTKLNSLGIQLFALDGDPNWVNDPSLYANLLTMLKGQSAIFTGLHLDIEPYTCCLVGTVTDKEPLPNSKTRLASSTPTVSLGFTD
jgi:hypothetical protein